MENLKQANCIFSFEILRTPNTLILSHKCSWYIFGLCGWTGLSPSRLICHDYKLLLHKTAKLVQTSRPVFMWTKTGVFTVSLSPNPFTTSASANFSPASVASFQSVFHSQWWGAQRSAAHQLHFSVTYTGQLFIEQEQIYNGRRVVGKLGRRQAKPRNICPFKGISSLVCSESTPGVSALHC